MTEDVTEVVSLDLLAIGTVAIVTTGFIVCWKVVVSTTAGVAIDIAVVAGNGGVGKLIPVVGDTALLMGETVEVLEARTLTEVFVVSSLGENVLLTEDVETVGESTLIVTSFFAIVMMVPKLVPAVLDVTIRVVERDRIVDFVIGESFKAAEERIGIKMVVIVVGFAAVVVWAAVGETPVVITDNEDIEVVGIALARNVVVSIEITESFISAEDFLEVFRVNELAVGTNSVLMVESIVCCGVAVSARASVEIGVETVASNGSVGASITVVDNTTILTGAAVIVCETSNGFEVSVILIFEKDVFVTGKIGIVDRLNTVVASFVVPLVIVFEFVVAVADGVTPVVEGGAVADSAVAERFKIKVEIAAFTFGLIAVRPAAIVLSGAISVTLAVFGCKDIEGVFEVVGITVATNVVTPIFVIEMNKFEEDVIEVVRPDLIAVETVFVVRVAILDRWKLFVSTEACVVIDIAVAGGNSGVGEIIRVVCDTAVLMRGLVEVFEVFIVFLITGDFGMVFESGLVVTSFSAVVVTVLKVFEAVVDAGIPVVEANIVVEFVVEDSFKAVEESIGIGTSLLGVGSVAVIAWAVTVAAPAEIADNEGVEVGLEVLGFALVTNVVVSKEVTERFISAENVFDVVSVDVLSVKADFALMIVLIVCWGVVVSAGASVVIGAKTVTCNGGVVVLITVFVNVTALDGVTLVVGCNVVADSSVAESFKAVEENVAGTMGLIAVGLGAAVVSAAILVTLVVVVDNEDIEGELEGFGITVTTNVVFPLVIVERDNFTGDVIKVVRFDFVAVEIAFVVRVAIMGRLKVFDGT